MEKSQEIRLEGYLTIDTAIRENEPELVIEGYVLLASNNIFDTMTEIGGLYIQSQGPWRTSVWEQTQQYTGAGPVGLLSHIVRLQMSYKRPVESVIAIYESLRDGFQDEDVQ